MTAGRSGETVAARYLRVLRELGITRLFVNAGTDFAPLIEAYRRADAAKRFPDVVVCPHENLAVSMAHGAYLAEGVPQAVMVHTSVGTANAVVGVMTAARSRIPLLITAGRTPLHEAGVNGARDSGIHWAQEMYDQAGMLREFVKWDYELRSGDQLEPVLRRALELASGGVPGPVYLTLPREVLAAPACDEPATQLAPLVVPAEPAPEPAAVRRLAGLLHAARFPVLVTSTTGADPRSVELLDELANRFGIGVCEQRGAYVNATVDGPTHLGFAPNRWFADADVLCFLDVDVPWVPESGEPRADCTVVQCGPDPQQVAYPIRTHRCDLAITAGTVPLLTALLDELGALPQVPAERRVRIERAAQDDRRRRHDARDDRIDDDLPITKEFLAWALDQARDPEWVVVSEYWAGPNLVPNRRPATYYGSPTVGGLGWGLPAAMGHALIRPEQPTIAAVGDGAYLFANPAACHQVMDRYRLPVLVVVCNNAGWAAVDRSWRLMYGDAAAGAERPFSDVSPSPDFALYATASSGFGATVTTRSQLIPALRRALAHVTDLRGHALVDVRVG